MFDIGVIFFHFEIHFEKENGALINITAGR